MKDPRARTVDIFDEEKKVIRQITNNRAILSYELDRLKEFTNTIAASPPTEMMKTLETLDAHILQLVRTIDRVLNELGDTDD